MLLSETKFAFYSWDGETNRGHVRNQIFWNESKGGNEVGRAEFQSKLTKTRSGHVPQKTCVEKKNGSVNFWSNGVGGVRA